MKKKWSLLYPDRGIIPRSVPFSSLLVPHGRRHKRAFSVSWMNGGKYTGHSQTDTLWLPEGLVNFSLYKHFLNHLPVGLSMLEKGSNRGIYPDRGTIPRSGYNKLDFFFTKSWNFLDFQKLIACRLHHDSEYKKRSNFCIRTSVPFLTNSVSEKVNVVNSALITTCCFLDLVQIWVIVLL